MDSPLLTEQLRRYSGSDLEVAEAVLREVLPQLHEIAVRELRRERYIDPLCPSELITVSCLVVSSRCLGRGHRFDSDHVYQITL
jgi:hypothetical protein